MLNIKRSFVLLFCVVTVVVSLVASRPAQAADGHIIGPKITSIAK